MRMRILLADDHPIYLEGLANLLRSYDFEVVGSVADGLEAVKAAISLGPDVVLMDAQMPLMSGIEATSKIKEALPDTKIIILTGIEDDRLLFDSIQAGASGFLLKKLDGDALNRSLKNLQEGMNPFSPGVQDQLLKEFSRITGAQSESPEPVALNDRQERLLAGIARGLRYKEIGAELCISEKTVKYQIGKIKELCGVKTNTELIGYYRKSSGSSHGSRLRGFRTNPPDSPD